ncbi:MAG: DUF4870 domain-containing protein [Myxococcota bacterium]
MTTPLQPVQADLPSQAQKDERMMAMLAHLSAFAGWVIPFGNVLGPLLVWVLKKDTMPLVNQHGKEALNFQISLTLYMLVSAVLVLVVIGVFLLIGLVLFGVVVIILAAVKANQGLPYRYPLTIRFIK